MSTRYHIAARNREQGDRIHAHDQCYYRCVGGLPLFSRPYSLDCTMRQTILILVVALCWSACAGAAAQAFPKGVVLYWNCDDDAGFSWRDNHWQKGGSPRVTYDTTERVHGKASLRIEGEDGKDLWVVSLTHPARVTPGREYVLRFWAKTREVKGHAEVRVLAHRPKTEDRQYKPLGWVRLTPKIHYVLPSEQDWARHDVPIKKLPGGAGRLFVYLAVKGEGTAWFDEVSIAENGVDVPLGGKVALRDSDYAGIRFHDNSLPANLLKNGDFERGMSPWRVAGEGSTARIEAVAGGHALRIDTKEFTSLHVWQQAPIDPRRRYRLSLRARTAPPGLTGYVFSQVLPFNRHGRPMGWVRADHAQEFTYVTGKTDGWVGREQVFSVRPDSQSVVIYLRVADTIGTVWIDDVRLAPLPMKNQGSEP